MIDNLEWVEAFQDLRDILLDRRFPYGYPSGCRNNQHNVFPFFHYKAFDDHHADKGFAEADAITEERAGILIRYLNQAVVSVSLILGQLRINL